MASNSNSNLNGYSASSTLTEFVWNFPQEVINNGCAIFNSIITPTKITLKNNSSIKPTPSYGRCFVLIDKSKIPAGANSATFMANQKIAITGGQQISYDTLSPTFVNSFSEIDSLHFPNAFGHLTGTTYSPSESTTPFLLLNGNPVISLTDYLEYSGFSPTATDGWYATYSKGMTPSQFSPFTDGALDINDYVQAVQDNSQWEFVSSNINYGSNTTIVIPTQSEITVDLYSSKTNEEDQAAENSGIAYSSWSVAYLGYQETYNRYLANFQPQSNSVSIPSNIQSQQSIADWSAGLYYVAQPNGNGTWNTSVFPGSGVFSNGSITFNGNFSIGSVEFVSDYVQAWSTSTISWNNSSSYNWMCYVTDTGDIYSNSYTLDDIFTNSVAGTNEYYYVSVNVSNNGFSASFINPKADSQGNPPTDAIWTTNSDGVTGGDGSWLMIAPNTPSFLLSGYYYNMMWSGQVGWGQNWNAAVQGPYPALNAAQFTQHANNTPIMSYGKVVQITIPIINYMQYSTKSKNLTESTENDIEKIANKYYAIGDTIVQSYYNHCLQVIHYLQTLSTVSNTQELLVKYLNVATAYNLLEPLLSEWIRGYPLTSLPQATQSIYNSLGDTQNITQINDMIASLFQTTIPGAVTGVTLCSTSESPSDNHAASVVTPSTPITGAYMMPSAVRFVLTKTLSMGVLLQHLSSQSALLKHLQSSLSNIGNGGSLPTNKMSLSSQQTQVASLVTNVMQSQFNNTQKSQSLNPSLFYPTLDEVTASVMAHVEGIRDLVIDRIYGLSSTAFNAEIKNMLTNISQEVHALLTDFCNIVTTSVDFITPKFPAISNIVSVLNNTVISNLAHPIAFSVSLITRLVADVINDVTNLLAPGSEILTLFEDANILRPVPIALTPTGPNSIFSYAVSASEQQFTNIDWWGIDWQGNLLSTSNLREAPPTPSTTDAPGVITLMGMGSGSKYWLYSFNLGEGIYKQTLLTIGGLVDVWMSTMWEVCSDGLYHRTGRQSIYFVPHPVVDIDGKISIPKSFHKFIVVGLLSASLLYGKDTIAQASNIISTMSQWPGFENFQSHISLAAVTTAEVADAGAASIATAMGIDDLFGDASGAKEEFTVATEDVINAVKVGMTYSRAAAMNVFNSVNQHLTEVEQYFKNLYTSSSAPTDAYLNNFSTSSTQMNPFQNALPLYYKESGAYLFGDVILATAKVSGSLWVQHKIFKHFSDLATKKKEDDIKKDAVLGSLGTFALNKYHRLVNNSKRVKELDAQSKKINAAFMNEPLYEKLAQRNLAGMTKQELSEIQANEGDLSKIISDMVDDVGSRGLN